MMVGVATRCFELRFIDVCKLRELKIVRSVRGGRIRPSIFAIGAVGFSPRDAKILVKITFLYPD